ncbi:hypothetical protein HOQ51_gp54 [uncultured phage_MedDCM-OCT-S35-C6]|nr:hypothetical protein HOQ51_gp54 [uncultured phage_MedDCM-OCT-S35-C6]
MRKYIIHKFNNAWCNQLLVMRRY